MKSVFDHSVSRRSLSLAIPSLFASVASSAEARIDSRLESQIEGYIKSLRAKGRISSAERTAWLVYDLQTGEKIVSINETAQLQAASMIKPYFALAFFHRVQAGEIIYGSTSRRHMELMIQKSNNESTNWVLSQAGGPAAAEALLKRHYPSLSRNIRIAEYIPKGGRTYRNLGSASDYHQFLVALWQGRLPYSKEILRVMGLPGIDRLYYDARHVPKGTAVYNKTGSTAMCCGDMGILLARGRNGRTYPYIVVGIISRSQRCSSYGPWISARADVIREVSNLTYLAMKKRHPLA